MVRSASLPRGRPGRPKALLGRDPPRPASPAHFHWLTLRRRGAAGVSAARSVVSRCTPDDPPYLYSASVSPGRLGARCWRRASRASVAPDAELQLMCRLLDRLVRTADAMRCTRRPSRRRVRDGCRPDSGNMGGSSCSPGIAWAALARREFAKSASTTDSPYGSSRSAVLPVIARRQIATERFRRHAVGCVQSPTFVLDFGRIPPAACSLNRYFLSRALRCGI